MITRNPLYWYLLKCRTSYKNEAQTSFQMPRKTEYMKSFTHRATSILQNKVISSLFQPGALKMLLDYNMANDGHYKPIQLEDSGWRDRGDPMFALSSLFFKKKKSHSVETICTCFWVPFPSYTQQKQDKPTSSCKKKKEIHPTLIKISWWAPTIYSLLFFQFIVWYIIFSSFPREKVLHSCFKRFDLLFPALVVCIIIALVCSSTLLFPDYPGCPWKWAKYDKFLQFSSVALEVVNLRAWGEKYNLAYLKTWRGDRPCMLSCLPVFANRSQLKNVHFSQIHFL